MKTLTFTLLLSLIWSVGFAQNAQGRLRIDSLKRQLTIAKHDTSRVLIMVQLCNSYRVPQPDSALFLGQQTVKLAQKIHFPKGEIQALAHMGRVQLDIGSLPKSLEIQFRALQIAEDNHLPAEKALPLGYIGSIYFTLENHPKAISYYRQAMVIYEANHNYPQVSTQKMNIGNAFEKINQLDSALYYEQQAYEEMLRAGTDINPIIFRNLGNIQAKLGNNRLAMDYYQKSLPLSIGRVKAIVLNLMAKLYQKENQLDSSIYYAQRGLDESKLTNYKQGILDGSTLLSELYEAKDLIKAFSYHKIAAAAKDSLFGPKQLQALQTIVVEEQVRQQEAEAQREAERVAYQTQLRQYAFLAGLGVLFLIAFILYRTNKQQKKANHLLHRQKEEINLQRDKAEKALTELKSTQAQLIQKEKLASLGELTAGIAHEIQNPLNFVNNFSELSVDLAQELKEEVEKPNIDKELVSDLVGDLVQNQEKINHHGKRASSIVKGMLEHSRTATGERQLTDINQLADEYLRLAYHGLKAKNQDGSTIRFNCELITDFDPNLPQIEIIPQDIGRVLLNLINNAFYAVNVGSVQNAADVNYSPKVIVRSQTLDNQIVIQVKDNGTGMSKEVQAKIFQPFFTTKPTGEGTGLGLSLAYDIVTKGHGGIVEVETTEGEGTTFTVKLPISTHS
ncbi:ATP-binding protein [Runella sp.]|jgi:two-component system, NtrC family, sensor kinase|uniref:tetratricopeptide repeat-containing sensor histidine kinase n=1 Tax=Runella sp. TaxID=1960881 RepID=UPI00263792FF|nr:ATP-binding protein [Runella sp.]